MIVGHKHTAIEQICKYGKESQTPDTLTSDLICVSRNNGKEIIALSYLRLSSINVNG